ncbi:Flavin transferase ApbE [Acididesulfobacillus acetoxydans]|uniref:ApbE family n=1 Tax=Acididesulfobacillus acetoxydans TaxID=1561005 RepID=A0A8S0VWF8_9FIRM|nr:UPF0280 family protein [Acididesulfobacillus acetoxydans]CAA7600823.1 Flavin transferase ApbE [Acididesulfobacillus acetoxydans]CEJ09244.1 ApbE family [Acididesulfobacillus acetoxydans]
MLKRIDPYKVLVDIGPVQMSIWAGRKGEPLGREWRKLENLVKEWLADIRRYLPEVKKPWPQLNDLAEYNRVVQKMHAAVRDTGDPSLTSMAAVAGTLAGMTCEYLVYKGATKVLVNNGGDLAIFLGKEEKTKVGIVPRLGVAPSHYLEVKGGSKIGGVATSGRGGRSFTLGIADAAVAIAARPEVADACATVLGNAVNVDSVLIERRPAREIDPDTDIPRLLVTTAVAPLSVELRTEALDRGLQRARRLVQDKLLLGAVLFLNGDMRQYPEDLVRPVTASGS